MRRNRPFALGFAALCASLLAAGCGIPGPNDAEIGCAYDPQSSPLCVGYDAGSPATDASEARPGADARPSDAAPPEGGGEGEGGAAAGIGASCSSSSDCASLAADYCLVSPTGTFPSFCTYTHCTEAQCGSGYACCDCTMSPISLVNTFPPGICVLPMTAAALPSYGCTCMPQAP
jgi:hypothetical protein